MVNTRGKEKGIRLNVKEKRNKGKIMRLRLNKTAVFIKPDYLRSHTLISI